MMFIILQALSVELADHAAKLVTSQLEKDAQPTEEELKSSIGAQVR